MDLCIINHSATPACSHHVVLAQPSPVVSVTAKLAKNSLFTIRFPTTIMASQYYQSLIIVDSDHKAFPFPTVGPCVGNFGIRKPLQIPTKKNHHII